MYVVCMAWATATCSPSGPPCDVDAAGDLRVVAPASNAANFPPDFKPLRGRDHLCDGTLADTAVLHDAECTEVFSAATTADSVLAVPADSLGVQLQGVTGVAAVTSISSLLVSVGGYTPAAAPAPPVPRVRQGLAEGFAPVLAPAANRVSRGLSSAVAPVVSDFVVISSSSVHDGGAAIGPLQLDSRGSEQFRAKLVTSYTAYKRHHPHCISGCYASPLTAVQRQTFDQSFD
jgi:hypothetical protein